MFYESDLSADPCMRISVRDIMCLGVSRPDSSNGFLDRFELSLVTSVTDGWMNGWMNGRMDGRMDG